MEGCTDQYCLRAVTGHKGELLAAILIVIPWRKGSVFEALMCIFANSWDSVKSWTRRVVEGSYFVLWEEVYSETRRKPKKAVVRAAQILSLSS